MTSVEPTRTASAVAICVTTNTARSRRSRRVPVCAGALLRPAALAGVVSTGAIETRIAASTSKAALRLNTRPSTETCSSCGNPAGASRFSAPRPDQAASNPSTEPNAARMRPSAIASTASLVRVAPRASRISRSRRCPAAAASRMLLALTQASTRTSSVAPKSAATAARVWPKISDVSGTSTALRSDPDGSARTNCSISARAVVMATPDLTRPTTCSHPTSGSAASAG